MVFMPEYRPLKRGRPNHVTTGLSRVVVPVVSPAAATGTDHHNSVSSIDSLLEPSHNGQLLYIYCMLTVV